MRNMGRWKVWQRKDEKVAIYSEIGWCKSGRALLGLFRVYASGAEFDSWAWEEGMEGKRRKSAVYKFYCCSSVTTGRQPGHQPQVLTWWGRARAQKEMPPCCWWCHYHHWQLHCSYPHELLLPRTQNHPTTPLLGCKIRPQGQNGLQGSAYKVNRCAQVCLK